MARRIKLTLQSVCLVIVALLWLLTLEYFILRDDTGLQFGNDFKKPVRKAEYLDKGSKNLDAHIKVSRCSQYDRKSLLHNKCNKTGSILDLPIEKQNRVYDNIFVDTKHKIMACLPPKSGCSTWKTILANNTYDNPLPSNYPVMNLHGWWLPQKFNIKRLYSFSPAERSQMLHSKEYFKFMVARHPLERLRSAYINKFESGVDPFMMNLHGSKILRLFYPGRDEEFYKKGAGVTFDQFIQYIKFPYSDDNHWQPIDSVCQPCYVDYDHILKTETLNDDNVEIIKAHLGPYYRGIGQANNIVAGGQQHSSLTAHGRKLDIFQQLDKHDIEYVLKRFSKDFEHFGYTYRAADEKILFSSCVHGASDKMCC